MDAKQFRLGNYVQSHNGILTVSDLTNDISCSFKIRAWQVNGGSLGNSDEFIKPIPLTEQWLIDFGCECNEYSSGKYYSLQLIDNLWFYSNKFGNGICTSEIECATCSNYGEEIDIVKNIEFVHVLQNWYYMFKGEELIRKNK
jgi:hypothetical protein